MSTLGVIGIPFGMAAFGGVVGFVWGFREGGDINIAPIIYGPIGALIGGFVGLIISAVVAR